MLPRLSLIIGLLVVLLALPATAARGSSTQSMTFEAPRELLDPATRDHALRRDPRLRRRPRARARLLAELRARSRRRRRKPAFDAADPAAYPAGTWDALDALFTAAAARGIAVQLTLTGPVPKWATASKKDNVTKPEPEGVPGVRDRGRAPLRRPGRRCGRSGTSPTTRSSSSRSSCTRRRSRRASTATSSSPASAASARPATAATRCCSARPRRAAPRASSRRSRSCAERCASTRSYHRKGHCARISAGGFAHHAYTTRTGPALPPAGQGRRHDRRPVAALATR